MIMRTIELGVTITDAAVDEETTTIFCTLVARDPRCPDCGREGRYRDTITRPLTDLPVAGYPLVLKVAVPRLPLHDRRVRADGVQPGSREVGGTEIVDDAALRAVCVAPVDD